MNTLAALKVLVMGVWRRLVIPNENVKNTALTPAALLPSVPMYSTGYVSVYVVFFFVLTDLFGLQTTSSVLTVSGGSTRVQPTDTSSSAKRSLHACPARAS